MLDYSNVDELNKHLLEIQTHDEALLEILEEWRYYSGNSF